MRRVAYYPFAYEIGPKFEKRRACRYVNVPRRFTGDIRNFSVKSRSRLMAAIKKRPEQFTFFYTLTSPEGLATRKREILKALRYKCKQLGIYYVWVGEFHQSGKMHLHFLASGDRKLNRELKKYLRNVINRPLGLRYVDRLVTSKEIDGSQRVFFYLAKYLTKQAGHEAEFIGRRWGRNYKDALISVHEAPAEIEELGDYLDWHLSRIYPKQTYRHLIADWEYAQYPPAPRGSWYIGQNDEKCVQKEFFLVDSS